MRQRVYPCIMCGAPTRGSNRCPQHRLVDDRPTLRARGSTGLSKRLRRQVLFRDRWTCAQCGLKDRTGANLDADHVVRLADGGAHTVDNMQTLCKDCHREKTRLENLARR